MIIKGTQQQKSVKMMMAIFVFIFWFLSLIALFALLLLDVKSRDVLKEIKPMITYESDMIAKH